MLSFKARAEKCEHPLTKELFTLMDEKQTNLAVAADFTRSADILKLAEQVGPSICVFKTHIDICEDFTPDLPRQLQHLAKKHRFFIFEDRKFADIGNTVLHQYQGGLYHIADWAKQLLLHSVICLNISEPKSKLTSG